MQFVFLLLIIFALYQIWQRIQGQPKIRTAKDKKRKGTVIDINNVQSDFSNGPLPYQKYPYLQRERAERLFFDGLQERLEGKEIDLFPSVSLSRIIFVPKSTKNYGAYYSRINGKTIDIVLCRAGTREVLAVIFLDYYRNEGVNEQEEAIFVDRALEKAGLPYFHFMASDDGYDWEYILNTLKY